MKFSDLAQRSQKSPLFGKPKSGINPIRMSEQCHGFAVLDFHTHSVPRDSTSYPYTAGTSVRGCAHVFYRLAIRDHERYTFKYKTLSALCTWVKNDLLMNGTTTPDAARSSPFEVYPMPKASPEAPTHQTLRENEEIHRLGL
jgi:hypothetical protein